MKKFLILGLSLYLFSCLSFADEQLPSIQNTSSDKIQNVFSKYGVNYNLNGNNIDIVIDREKALQSIPILKAIGIMNPDISQTEINESPTIYAGLVGLLMMPEIIVDIYKTNNNVDNLKFTSYLLVADNYGNNKKHQIYSFNFDRHLYEKINWNNFSSEKLVKIAPNFKSTSYYSNNTDL